MDSEEFIDSLEGMIQEDADPETETRENHLPLGPVGYIYIVHAAGSHFIKIGYAADVYARKAELQVGCPYPLRILYIQPTSNALIDEGKLHERFARYRLRGEWFELPSSVPDVLEILGDLYHHEPVPKISRSAIEPYGDMRGKILRALQEAATPLSIDDICEALGSPRTRKLTNHISQILWRCIQAGQITRVSRGMFTATE